MDAVTTVTWQPSLLDLGARPDIDPSLAGLRRIPLDDRSWVDLLPGWVRGADALLEEFCAVAPWAPQQERWMYDRVVREPRIIARWPEDAALPAVVDRMRAVLSARYATDFDLLAVNLYRDGRDSVAWHGDRVRHTHTDPMVVTVSLGARRRFLLKPRAGGPMTLALTPGAGDLVVMGGACQHDFVHTVPKTTAHVGARMSLTLRHSGEVGAFRPPAP